jgi:hypothetical protein
MTTESPVERLARLGKEMDELQAEQIKINREIFVVAFLSGRFDRARVACEKILVLDPDNAEARKRLAKLDDLEERESTE